MERGPKHLDVTNPAGSYSDFHMTGGHVSIVMSAVDALTGLIVKVK